MDLRVIKRTIKVERLIEKVLKIIEEKGKEEEFMKKEISKKAREELIMSIGRFYKKMRKGEKKKVLDFLVGYLGYNRSYGRALMRKVSREGNFSSKKVRKKERKKIYDEEVKEAIKKLWELSDYLCGKRLKAIIPALIEKIEKYGGIEVRGEVKEKVLKVSAATIDRILKEERKKYKLRCKARTKPGTLLKKQIQIKTFSEWDEKKAGFLEIDLVSHDGGDARGEFAWTLNATDVKTGWMSFRAIKNKAENCGI